VYSIKIGFIVKIMVFLDGF